MKRLILFLMFALILSAMTLSAQTKETHMLSAADQKDVLAVLQAHEDAWAKRDMVAFAALLTEDCDWVNVVGMHWKSRDEVTHMHDVLLHGRYKGVNIHTVATEVSEVAPGVAMIIGKYGLDDFTTPDGQHVTGMQTMGTMVLVKHDGTWLIRAAENVQIDPRASMRPPVKP